MNADVVSIGGRHEKNDAPTTDNPFNKTTKTRSGFFVFLFLLLLFFVVVVLGWVGGWKWELRLSLETGTVIKKYLSSERLNCLFLSLYGVSTGA